MRARLMCGRNVLERYVDAHTWSISRQRMMPPRNLYKKFASKGERLKKKEAVFLRGDELKSISRTDIDSFFGARK